MRKRICIILIILMSTILTSCSLADKELYKKETENYYMTGLSFAFDSTEESDLLLDELNAEDYFNISFDSEDILFSYTDDNNITQKSIGIVSNNDVLRNASINFTIDEDHLNDELISKSYNTTVTGTIYLDKKYQNLVLYPIIKLQNKNSTSFSTNMQKGISTGNVDFTYEYEYRFKLDKFENIFGVDIDFKYVDELKTVEINEYSSTNELILNTQINNNSDKLLILTDSTEYVICVKTYIDSNGNEYKLRTAISNEYPYFIPMFLNKYSLPSSNGFQLDFVLKTDEVIV